MKNKISKTVHKQRKYIETGTIYKKWTERVRVALVYPNSYHVGMSNLGFQNVYYLINEIDNLVCERFFLSDNLTDNIFSVESKRQLNDFDLIAFSISFENDYLNILSILQNAGIPKLSNNRENSYPLVIAGGVACILNPEPIAAFVDCFLIGDARELINPFFNIFDPNTDKKEILKKLVLNLNGIYVPSFYKIQYNENNTIKSFIPKSFAPDKVIQVFSKKDHIDNPAFTKVITPNTTFSNTLLIEVTRGCPHGCRFCSAGFIYRPPRFSFYSKVENLIRKNKDKNGNIKIGLVGAAVSDYPKLNQICQFTKKNNLKISFSSLRADALTPELITSLEQNNVKTATIAPEAGSERMRRVINKGITEEDILVATKNLVENNIPNLKLYFMIGLPTETIEDIDAIVELSKKIKSEFLNSSKIMKKIGQITVSINPFIPKAITPFQWASMDCLTLLKKKIKIIKNGLRRVPNLRVHADTPRSSHINALLSCGNQKMAEMLISVDKSGRNWATVLKNSPTLYTIPKYSKNDILPWDFIDHGIKKSFLLNEYTRAVNNKTSPPCFMKSCDECKVCRY